MPTVIDAVVVHWNQGAACAQTIKRLRNEPLVDRIFLVDNGSRPEELHAATSGSDVEVISLGVNRGFGPGTNAGWTRWLSLSETEWCLVLPHDAYAAADTIAQMAAIGESNPRIGLLCADVGDGMLPVVDPNFGPILKVQAEPPGFQSCDYPHGTMFMARRACLREIGLFDERFFTYCEEADLGVRAASAGWGVGMAVGSRVFNPRVSTPRPVAGYLMERNTLLLVSKHFGAFPTMIRTTMSLWQLMRGVLQPSSRDEYWSTRARVLALRDAAFKRWGPPPDLA